MGPKEFPWSKRASKIPPEETFCFSSLSASLLPILLSANLFSFSFVSMYFISSVYFISLAFPILPFLLPFSTKLPLIDHCLECNCVFSLHVFLSIYYFPSSISQSSFYPLGGLRIIPGIFRVKKTKALTEKKKNVQGHSKLVQMRRTEDTAPTKTMSLTGPRPYHRYKNQLSSSNPTSQILE